MSSRSRRVICATLFAAIGLIILPVKRVVAQEIGEKVAAAQPAGDPSYWRVILAEGETRWRRLPTISLETSWQILEAGAELPPGTELLTGDNGQVRLSRADDEIRVGPDTWLTLESDAGDLVTRISQTLGTVWYSVRSRVSGRFRVDTTRLVAVVKGTEFEISIESDTDQMLVREGVVSARATAGGRAIDVRAGQRVRASASGLVLIAAPDGGSNSGDESSPDRPAAPDGGSEPGGGTPPDGGGTPDGGNPGNGGQQPDTSQRAGNNGSRGNGPQDGNNGATSKSGNNGKGFGGGGDKSRGRQK